MLKKHAQFFKSLFILSDLFMLSLSWVLSYFLRFYTPLIKPSLSGIPPFWSYVEFLLPLWVIWFFASQRVNLYRPRRIGYFAGECFDIVKTLVFTFLLLITVIYLLKRFEFSRLAFLYFLVIAVVCLIVFRFSARKIIGALREKGYNQRFAVIAGGGLLGKKVLEEIELHHELGIRVIGFLTRQQEKNGKKIKGFPVLGTYEDIDKIFNEKKIDVLFVAISINEYENFEKLIKNVQGNLAEIKVVPGSYEFLGLRGGMDELGDLPIVNLQSSPLYGWDSFVKRMFDVILGSIILIIASPLMLIISLLIKLTSEGPIIYKQERMGMDGCVFEMLKFRTMKMDAEKETGPVWAEVNDRRKTKIGSFLRKTSLDELPQLCNVLKGEMSLVGPRPERPNFVKKFMNRIPLYMLRHKTKAGMTGWAQVNGWRGSTSLKKRIEYDLYYIQHWSMSFDLKILFMTLWRGFFNKAAY